MLCAVANKKKPGQRGGASLTSISGDDKKEQTEEKLKIHAFKSTRKGQSSRVPIGPMLPHELGRNPVSKHQIQPEY